jgi:CRISPR-associated protein Cmr2
MKYLLAVSIGPVQSFIAAARRTRDLWSGSLLLSEISKAVARHIEEIHPGGLIFPAPENPEALDPGTSLAVSNIILAEVTAEDEEKVGRLAEGCERAGRDRWADIAGRALTDARSVVDERLWQQQIGGVLEFYAHGKRSMTANTAQSGLS